VLVAHRDPRARARIVAQLAAHGYAVRAATSAAGPPRRPPDVIVLGDPAELPLAGGSRVLALIPGSDEGEIVGLLAAGADDVLAGPLRTTEIAARVAALLRRRERVRLEIGPLAIDRGARTVTLGGVPLVLRRREYEVLAVLAEEPGRVFTKSELLRAIWGGPAAGQTRALDVQVARLRRRLGAHAGLLVTVWGVGYRLGERSV
jgi:DNA-binding response OmpR family regulator